MTFCCFSCTEENGIVSHLSSVIFNSENSFIMLEVLLNAGNQQVTCEEATVGMKTVKTSEDVGQVLIPLPRKRLSALIGSGKSCVAKRL